MVKDDSQLYGSLLLTPVIEVNEDEFSSVRKKSQDDYYLTPRKMDEDENERNDQDSLEEEQSTLIS